MCLRDVLCTCVAVHGKALIKYVELYEEVLAMYYVRAVPYNGRILFYVPSLTLLSACLDIFVFISIHMC